MSRVTDIRYVGYGVADLAAEQGFYATKWCLKQVAEANGMTYFAAEGSDELYKVGMREDPVNRIDVIALKIETREDIDALHNISFEGKELAALWTCGEGEGARSAIVYCNGLDSTKELLYFSWLSRALGKRGISTLCIDQPGIGEALRMHGLVATHESQRWASPWVDWLERQPEVDAARLGMTGISLGDYFAPRAVALEPRFAAGAVWGANHDWREVQEKRLRREGDNPVPHYWIHVMWVFGAEDINDSHDKAVEMTPDGVMKRIGVPFLVTHGEQDRQIALDYAHHSFDQLTGLPDRELKIFTPREGGVEHVGADNMSFGREYLADWFAENLGGQTA